MTVILITGACCAAAVAVTAWLILRLTRDLGRHVADPLAGAGLIVNAAYEVHHEDFTSWEGAPTRPRRAEGTPVQTGLSGGQGGAPTGAAALATAPHELPGAGTSTSAPGPDVPGRAASAAPAVNNPAGDPPVTPPDHRPARLTSPFMAGLTVLTAVTAPIRLHLTEREMTRQAELEAEALAAFPPWKPWPGDDTLTSMRAIKAGA